MSSENIVKLNVGGSIFQTSKSTLTKFDGFFKTLLETGVPIAKDESGAIFIDRDPAHFRLILNYMRDGKIDLQKYSEDIKEIQNEAEYYELEGLVQKCSTEIENHVGKITEKVEKIKTEDPKSESSGAFVKLNIGGTIFETSKSTLTKFNGFFKTMLETGVPIAKDETGAILIDRSPKHFDRILTFLRDGKIELPDSSDVKEIQMEAQYYLLKGLVELCESRGTEKNEIRNVENWNEETNAVLSSRKKAVLIVANDPERPCPVHPVYMTQFMANYGHVFDVFATTQNYWIPNFIVYDKSSNQHFSKSDIHGVEKMLKSELAHLL